MSRFANSLPRIGVLFVVALSGMQQSIAAGAQQPAKQFIVQTAEMLAADEHLQTRVSHEQYAVPVADLLRELSPKGFSLTADSSCADLKLQLRLKNRPLHAVMQSLAQLLPGYWITHGDGKGLELVMSREAVLKRETWWHLFESEREKAKSALRAKLLEKMRSEPYVRKPGDPNPENSDISLERENAANHNFFRALPPSLQEQIVNMPNDCPLFSMGTGGYGGNDEDSMEVQMSSLPPAAQKMAQAQATTHFKNANAPDLENAWVKFIFGGTGIMASLRSEDGKLLGNSIGFSAGVSAEAMILSLQQGSMDIDFARGMTAWEVKQKKRDLPENWKKLAAYQASRVWKNDPPDPKRMMHRPHTRRETLDWLAQQTDMEYISDCYMEHEWMTIPEEIKKKPPTVPLAEELNFQAGELDISWKKQANGLYLFRNNRWYRDDRLEIPLPTLQRLYFAKLEADDPKAKNNKTVQERVKQRMDWDADALQSLSLYQIGVKLESFMPDVLPPDILKQLPKSATQTAVVGTLNGKPHTFQISPFRGSRDRIANTLNTLRFYAGLDDKGRTDLIAGKLAYETLSADQKKRALRLLPRLRSIVDQTVPPPVLLQLVPQRYGATFEQFIGETRLSFVKGSNP